MTMIVPFKEDDRIGFSRRMTRVGLAWRRVLEDALRGFGLTDSSWRPVLLLGQSADAVRQGDMARILLLDPPALARLLDGLERDKLVHREEDPADRRSKLVRLTASGRKLYGKVSAVALEIGGRVLADVGAEELAQCHAVFDSIEQALQMEAQALERPDP